MAEMWMAKRVQEPFGAQMAYDAAPHRARLAVNLALGLKSLPSRLAAMYRIPCVHPLASLTTISGRGADHHDMPYGSRR